MRPGIDTAPSLQEQLNNLFLLMVFAVIAGLQLDLYPAGMHEDDAFFYFQIARNIIETGRSSFDGIGITNGYHLLWMAVLAGVGSAFAQVMPMGMALIAVSSLPLLLFAWMCRPLVFLQILIACYYVGFGMEGILASLLFIALAWTMQEGKPGIAFVVSIGIVLSRIDFSICLGLLTIWSLFYDRKMIRPLILGTLCGVLVNFAGNWMLTEEVFSISSLQKSGIGRAIASPEMVVYNFSSISNQIRLGIWLGAMAVLILARQNLGSERNRVLFSPAFHLALLGFIVVHSFVSATRDWYFAVPVLVAIYAAGRAAAGLSWQTAPTLLLCIVIPLAGAGVQLKQHWDAATGYHEYVRELVAVDQSPLFVFDGAGYIGWQVHPAQVVNGDGLVNSFDYARNANDPDWFMTYLAENGINRFVTNRALKTCITAAICCAPDSLDKVAEFATTHGGLADTTYAFRDGVSCQIIPREETGGPEQPTQ